MFFGLLAVPKSHEMCLCEKNGVVFPTVYCCWQQQTKLCVPTCHFFAPYPEMNIFVQNTSFFHGYYGNPFSLGAMPAKPLLPPQNQTVSHISMSYCFPACGSSTINSALEEWLILVAQHLSLIHI